MEAAREMNSPSSAPLFARMKRASALKKHLFFSLLLHGRFFGRTGSSTGAGSGFSTGLNHCMSVGCCFAMVGLFSRLKLTALLGHARRPANRSDQSRFAPYMDSVLAWRLRVCVWAVSDFGFTGFRPRSTPSRLRRQFRGTHHAQLRQSVPALLLFIEAGDCTRLVCGLLEYRRDRGAGPAL